MFLYSLLPCIMIIFPNMTAQVGWHVDSSLGESH
jgi:hypothetical protein